MSADTHEVNVGLVDIDRNFPNSLSSVCMEENSFLSAKFSNLVHVLNYTNLVVHVHGTYAKNLFLGFFDSFSEELNIQNAAFLNR